MLNKAIVTLTDGKSKVTDTICYNGVPSDAIKKVMKYQNLKGVWTIEKIEIKEKIGL